MKLIIELSIVLVFLICIIIFLSIKIINNQLKLYDIKLIKSSNKLKKLLHEKFDLSFKTIEFLKKTTNVDEDLLYEFLNTNLRKVSLNELNNVLINTDEVIASYLEQNEKIINNKSFAELNSKLKELRVSISAIIDYYNEIVKEYNECIKKFPIRLYAKIKKQQQKEKLKEQIKTKLRIAN